MRRSKGYIFVETVIAMGVLSISTLVIQGGLRQAILTRGQAQDYTTARFLMEKVAGKQALLFQQPEGQGSGAFDPPFNRFAYEWKLERMEVPRPDLPATLDPMQRQMFEENFVDYMGKLTVRIIWHRAGLDFESVGETLLRPELIWVPEEMR